MARRRRARNLTGPIVALLFVGAGVMVYYSVFFKPIRDAGPPAEASVPPTPSAPLLAAESRAEGSLSPTPATTSPAATLPTTRPAAADSGAARSLVKAGLEAMSRGNDCEARNKLSAALTSGLGSAEANELRAHLVRLADRTIFGPAIVPDDPLVVAYVVQPGETLAQIAKAHSVTADLLARINGLVDKNRIREGQRLKVLRGPFSAVVNSQTFDLDVYLGTTLVKHFRVGLGTDGSTPTGTWKVQNKLKNPTYYPPRGGEILAADDPKNPLGERWIGLVGIEGDAVGQQRYGIHGTIEPESIGKNMSLGCVRLLNSDVELLFDMLVEEQSTVTIR